MPHVFYSSGYSKSCPSSTFLNHRSLAISSNCTPHSCSSKLYLYSNRKLGEYSQFIGTLHHKQEVSIIIYRGTDTSIVIHEFISSNLEKRKGKCLLQKFSTCIQVQITAPFINMRTLKFKAQPTNAFFSTVNEMFSSCSQLPTTAERTI